MLALATDILSVPKFCRCYARPVLPDNELAELDAVDNNALLAVWEDFISECQAAPQEKLCLAW